MNCSCLIFRVLCWNLVVVALIVVSVTACLLVVRPLPYSVIGPHMIFIEIVVAATSTVGGAVELFVGEVVFCCVEDVLESIRFVSWVSGI